MTKSLFNLYKFTSQSLAPLELGASSLSEKDLNNWRKYLINEVNGVQTEMVRFLLSHASREEKLCWMSSVQQQLIFVSDLLSNFLFRGRRNWEKSPYAFEIRSNYLYSISSVDELLVFAETQFFEYFDPNVKLTNFRLKVVVPELRVHLNALRSCLINGDISQGLIDCVIDGVSALINKNLSKNNDRYIRQLSARIQSDAVSGDESLIALLILMDFNQPEFFLYQVEHLDQRLFEVHGLHEQRELILQQRMVIKRIVPDQEFCLYPKQSSLVSDLDRYFSEREVALEALMELRRAAVKDKINADQAFRILMDMTVPQLALFFRVQMEVGLLIKDQISEVFNFVAQHFYTEKALFISSTNMLKLSTTIEFNTVLKVYDMLSKMTAWLDEQFAVSNYRR